MIRRLLGKLLMALLALAAALSAYFYVASPSTEVQLAFSEYKAATVARDAKRVADLTAQKLVDFYDAQRKIALTASREELIALPFRQRWTVFTLKALVFHGAITLSDMQRLEGRDFLRKTSVMLPPVGQVVAQSRLMMVLPFGPGRARGYLDPTGLLPDGGIEILLVPVFHDIRFDFVRSPAGWLVDPSPFLESSLAENERLGKYQEPSGNTYLFAILGVKDAAGQEPYWQPLLSGT
jgi:hypothetical protein